MVDTTLFNPSDVRFTTDTIVKILLGAINGLLDRTPNPSSFPRPGNMYR